MVGPLFQWSLDTVGWRETHRLGSVAAFLIAIPTGLFIFHTPESVGYATPGFFETCLEVFKMVISLGVRSCTVDGVAQPAKAYEATEEREGLLGSEEEGTSEEAAQNSSVYSSSTRVRDYTRREAMRTCVACVPVDPLVSTWGVERRAEISGL